MKKEERLESIELRKKGFSLKEISEELKVSKSTVSVWVKDVKLSKEAELKLSEKVSNGQRISATNRKSKTAKNLKILFDNASEKLNKKVFDALEVKLFCSLMYWCEGGKSEKSHIQFINSDPLIIATFLNLFRQSYNLDEKKFRICLHLHSYHLEENQIRYWSKISGIPQDKFIKTFQKGNSGKRIKKDYQGCVSIRYYDAKIAHDIMMTGKAFLQKFGSLV